MNTKTVTLVEPKVRIIEKNKAKTYSMRETVVKVMKLKLWKNVMIW